MTETSEWDLYQKGLDYKRKINLHAEIDKNERFYAGDQWHGVKANGLPTPVLNVLKRVIQYKLSQILANNVTIKFSANVDDNTQDPMEIEFKSVADMLTDYMRSVWEHQKQDVHNRSILKDSAITGDGIQYSYFDPTIETGQVAKGDVANEIIDNVNYFPGDTNNNKVQPQPYIVLAFRSLIEDLKDEARLNGVSEEQIKLIAGDTETQNQSGDRSKIELEDNSKTICLLKMWKDKDTQTVWFKKSTKYCEIKPKVNTGLKRYPISIMTWEERKNSCHGTSEVHAQIPNQISINKLLAALIKSVLDTAFPKAIYNKAYIQKWSNTIGEAIAIDGGMDMDASKIASYLNTGNTSPEAYRLLNDLITLTKEMMGASEVALGEVKPENTSAFIAVNQAVAVPLQDIQSRYYDFVEDLTLNWADLMLTYYGERNITITKDGQTQVVPVNLQNFRDVLFRHKTDVGPSTTWSEIASMQTLDSLLASQQISFQQYLERVPDGVIPKKQELLEAIGQQMDMEAVNNFIMQLPPELQQVIMQYMNQPQPQMQGGGAIGQA